MEIEKSTVANLREKYFQPENLPQRPNLPVANRWTEIEETIEQSPVTIVIGSTGSGKTTLVPPLLLENELLRKGRCCRIVVTQPRRIAAIRIAEKVCHDRKWVLGSICGYKVGMEKEVSPDSCIQYVTTNLLVEKIVHSRSTVDFTHIIVDEIHERLQDVDVLLFLLKTLTEKTGYRPKIVLMSATAESNVYARYFGENNCRRVCVEGSVYSVKKLYLEDIPTEISSRIVAAVSSKACREDEHHVPGVFSLSADVMEAVADLIETFDEQDVGNVRGAVLIFLPGTFEIRFLIGVLEIFKDRNRYVLIPLHSRLSLEEQNVAFQSVKPHIRKIVIATNIAESSITLPDIRYVIDFCVTKVQVTSSESGFTSFEVQFCSRANCEQRAGRVGRVQNGIVYRLLKKAEYESLREYPTPEILQASINTTVLKIKRFGLERPREVLAKFIDPPEPEKVDRAVLTLKEIQAMRLEHRGRVDLEDGDLTILGRVMASLPLDIRLSKLILMGFAFGCFEECVKMAACLCVEDIFKRDFDILQYYKQQAFWARGHFSDPLVFLHVFDEYLKKRQECPDSTELRLLRIWAKKYSLQYRRLLEAHNIYEEVKIRLKDIGFSAPSAPNLEPRDEGLQNFFVMMALCGAFYPRYYYQTRLDYSTVKSALENHNPMSTMMISGFPENHGPLYAQAIRAALSECLTGDIDLSFRGIDAFLTFKNSDNNGMPLDAYLCELYACFEEMSVPKLSDKDAERLLCKLAIPVDKDGSIGPEVKVLSLSNELATTFKKPPLPTNTSFKGTLSWFEDILSFYVLLEERQSKLQSLNCEIEDELRQNRAKLVLLKNPPAGTAVLAELDGRLHRGRVLGTPKKNAAPWARRAETVFVFFVDYGRSELVNFVYKLPESMLLCNNEAPFAYRAQLAHLKLFDGICRKPVPYEKLAEGNECVVDIFSIVDDTLRVELFVAIDEEEINLNEKLILDKLVMYDQEPDFSEDKSRLDFVENLVVKGEHYVDLNTYSLETMHLSGPTTPLSDFRLKALTCVDRLPSKEGSAVEISFDSINCVMFGETGIHRNFIVSHSERLTPQRKRLQLVKTTLMTKLPMMLPFVSLVFCPRAEYRCNRDETKFVGAICGLGVIRLDTGEYTPVNASNDLEVPFTQELDRKDAKIINEIRRLLDEAFCGRTEVFEWASVPILRIQKKIDDYVLRFFNVKNRKEVPSNAIPAKQHFQWTVNDVKTNPEDFRQSLFRPHPIPRIRNAEMYELLQMTESFLSSLSDPQEIRLSLCPLCCLTFKSSKKAIEHLRTTEHKMRYAKLKGVDYDENSPYVNK